MPPRSYRQYCAMARSLDVLGERWTLLIVRELLPGPKRFKDLLDGLPGVGTALLTARLRRMEQEGLLERRVLPPPASAVAYELTPAGQGLRPVVMALAEWGVKRLGPRRPDERFHPRWTLLALQSWHDPEPARGVHERYELRIDAHVFHIDVADGEIDVRDGPADRPALTVTTDGETFMTAARDGDVLAAALAGGRAQVTGDPGALERCLAIFAPALDLARSTRSAG